MDRLDEIRQFFTSNDHKVIVDKEDGDLAELRWCAAINKQTGYVCVRRRVMVEGKRSNVILARVILERKLGRSLLSGEYADHKDTDSLNNTRENLRVASKAQNVANSGLRSTNKSGYKGVHFSKKANKWRAEIRVNYRKINLGHYNTPEEAYKAYCAAADEYHHEFARLESHE